MFREEMPCHRVSIREPRSFMNWRRMRTVRRPCITAKRITWFSLDRQKQWHCKKLQAGRGPGTYRIAFLSTCDQERVGKKKEKHEIEQIVRCVARYARGWEYFGVLEYAHEIGGCGR